MQRSIFNPANVFQTFTSVNPAGEIVWEVRIDVIRYLSFIDDDLKKFPRHERLGIAVNKDSNPTSNKLFTLELSAVYRKADTNFANSPIDTMIRNVFGLLNRHAGLTTKDYIELVRAHEDFLKYNNIQSDYHAKVAKQHGANYRPNGNAY